MHIYRGYTEISLDDLVRLWTGKSISCLYFFQFYGIVAYRLTEDWNLER